MGVKKQARKKVAPGGMFFLGVVVKCFLCERTATVIPYDPEKGYAFGQFKRLGWGQREQKWVCPNCLFKGEKE